LPLINVGKGGRGKKNWRRQGKKGDGLLVKGRLSLLDEVYSIRKRQRKWKPM